MKELRELLEKASEREWMYSCGSVDGGVGGIYFEERPGQAYSVARQPRYQSKQQWEIDAALICAMKNALPSLLDKVERYEKALRDLATTDDDGICDSYECAFHVAMKALGDALEGPSRDDVDDLDADEDRHHEH